MVVRTLFTEGDVLHLHVMDLQIPHVACRRVTTHRADVDIGVRMRLSQAHAVTFARPNPVLGAVSNIGTHKTGPDGPSSPTKCRPWLPHCPHVRVLVHRQDILASPTWPDTWKVVADPPRRPSESVPTGVVQMVGDVVHRYVRRENPHQGSLRCVSGCGSRHRACHWATGRRPRGLVLLVPMRGDKC